MEVKFQLFLKAGARPSLSEVKIAEYAEATAHRVRFSFSFIFWGLKIILKAL